MPVPLGVGFTDFYINIKTIGAKRNMRIKRSVFHFTGFLDCYENEKINNNVGSIL